MKAMILAAGRGERMRPLTDNIPKPLLLAAGKPIIVYTIEQLVAAGFSELVINTAHLGSKISEVLGHGECWGINIQYIYEGEQALETAGGIINALPILGDEPFLVVNGDIATDYDFAALREKSVAWMHLVFMPNPPHHPEGDFHVTLDGKVTARGEPKYTFSGIGIYHPDAFKGRAAGVLKLRPVLEEGMVEQKISGEIFTGFWMDIGTPERLQALENYHLNLRN